VTKASDNAFPSILITEGTEPSAPAAGKQRLYIDSTTKDLKATNSSGVERTLEGGREIDYAQVTSGNISITATTEGTADTVVTGNAVTYDGTTIVLIEFYCPFAAPPAGNVNTIFALYDGSGSIGRMAQFTNSDAANTGRIPVHASRRLTPSNASHTYSIRAYVDSGTGTVNNGAGGSGNYMPLFIRITKV
jgi:hypothetical protein